MLNSADVIDFHDAYLAESDWPRRESQFRSGIWHFIELNHRFNSLLWKEEDLARRRNVADSEIAANKRAIDGFNQARNDAVERLDEILLDAATQFARRSDARLHSETPGAMVDRLSILALKIHHMGLQLRRTEVSSEHIALCKQKLARLIEQCKDLGDCLDALMRGITEGTAYFKIYRQYKMYNDPALNPQLYEATKAS